MKELLRNNIRALVPYSTARDDYKGSSLNTLLDANENPFDTDYNRYPDPRQRKLKQEISSLKGIPTQQIFVGNGSDEAIDLMYRLFCEPGKDNAVAIAPTYGMYGVSAQINDVEYRSVPLTADFELDTRALLSATDEHTKLLWICSPNNPTGNTFATADIEYLLTHFHGITILDEAYIDFSSTPSWLNRLNEFPHLVILQTFSKAWGLAGLRCGLAFASQEICAYMDRVKYPYNINAWTQSIVLDKITHARESMLTEVRTLLAERQRLLEQLPLCDCVRRVYPTEANFLLVEVDNPKQRYQQLIEQGIIVRDRSNVCSNCLRITIGTPEQNTCVLSILQNKH